jgi:hypothetical protein
VTPIADFKGPQSLNTKIKTETYKVTGGKFMIPREFHGRENTVAVYDISGKLLQKSLVKGNRIFTPVSRESARGVFIVKVN